MRRFICVLMLLTGGVASAQKQHSFYQELKTDIHLPQAAGKEVLRLYNTNKGPAAVTTQGIFRFENGNWSASMKGKGRKLSVQDTEGHIWLASQKTIQSERGQSISYPFSDTIRCLFWENKETLHVGTTGGLYTWNGKWTKQQIGSCVNDMLTDADGSFWVATNDGLWRRKSNWVNLDETLMAEGHNRTYLALATHNQGKDLVFSSPLAVGGIAGNGEHWIWRATDGLPYGPVHRIHVQDNRFWLATQKGAILRDSVWHYFHGRRWLPTAAVNDLLEIAPGSVWLATNDGISEIRFEPMTLSAKAVHYDSVIEKRHNRRGLINISRMSVAGDLSTSYTENEDNDGLWTACYLAAQCYRYAVTREPDALQKAVRTFEALERLETVTGISGYPARSYATAEDKVMQSKSPHPKQWHFSPDGKWQWLDDTSSDEITGHIYTLTLFYELVANETQKKRVIALIDRIVSHVVDNHFHLIDFDGKPTRWGVWHPDSLNHNPNWMYERGLNSLQILSFLKTAAYYTGNPKYEKTYQMLVREHGYAHNAVEAKIYGPFETSHSDDILNFFPYYGLFRHSGDDPNRMLFKQSLERSWRNVRGDRMPVWNVIASALLGKDCDLGIALEELQQYPIDLVDWTMENSHRWDLQIDPMIDRERRKQAIQPIRTPESGVSRWNTNPKRLDVGRGGQTEETGTYYLFAYWMGRHYGYWE